MKIHRFIGNFDLSQKQVYIDDLGIIKQVKNVLKLEPGETIILSNGKGMEAEILLELISKVNISGIIISKKTEDRTSAKSINLYLAILKKENFELAVQKSVECGVTNIIPVITERTVKTGLNFERLQKIVKEAAEQCGQNFLPQILPAIKFPEALANGKNADEKVLFHLAENKYTKNNKAKSSSIFIGPEGGFTNTEVELARKEDYKVSSLGPLTLRGETAAIIATYLLSQIN